VHWSHDGEHSLKYGARKERVMGDVVTVSVYFYLNLTDCTHKRDAKIYVYMFSFCGICYILAFETNHIVWPNLNQTFKRAYTDGLITNSNRYAIASAQLILHPAHKKTDISYKVLENRREQWNTLYFQHLCTCRKCCCPKNWVNKRRGLFPIGRALYVRRWYETVLCWANDTWNRINKKKKD
jgi:hypothetical protein